MSVLENGKLKTAENEGYYATLVGVFFKNGSPNFRRQPYSKVLPGAKSKLPKSKAMSYLLKRIL